MAGIRHLTASAIVFNAHKQVLLVHHNKLGQWLYPGGHIDPDEDPVQAAQREVLEETGIHTQVLNDKLFTHPAVTTHPPPYAIIEMDVNDSKIGPHRHIDLVYVLRATSGDLTAQLDEVGDAQWIAVNDLTALDTPPELPALVTEAAQWTQTRWQPTPSQGPDRTELTRASPVAVAMPGGGLAGAVLRPERRQAGRGG